jgi:hypothetical protein
VLQHCCTLIGPRVNKLVTVLYADLVAAAGSGSSSSNSRNAKTSTTTSSSSFKPGESS